MAMNIRVCEHTRYLTTGDNRSRVRAHALHDLHAQSVFRQIGGAVRRTSNAKRGDRMRIVRCRVCACTHRFGLGSGTV